MNNQYNILILSHTPIHLNLLLIITIKLKISIIYKYHYTEINKYSTKTNLRNPHTYHIYQSSHLNFS